MTSFADFHGVMETEVLEQPNDCEQTEEFHPLADSRCEERNSSLVALDTSAHCSWRLVET